MHNYYPEVVDATTILESSRALKNMLILNSIRARGEDSFAPPIEKLLSQLGPFKPISVFLEVSKYVLGVQCIIKKRSKKIIFKGAIQFLALHVILKC